MHILQILPRLEVGGVERGVVDLSAQLIARGHQVSVISAGGTLVDTLGRVGAKHYRAPVDQKSLASIMRCIPAVSHLIRQTNVDIVHARSRVPGWIGYAAARRTERPFITTCHGFYSPHLASRVMTWGRTVIVPSHALGRYLIDQFGAPAERLRMIPRGVDLEAFGFRGVEAARSPGTPRAWRIGIVGRLTPIKGHDVAIRALQQLKQSGVRATLCIFGDAPSDKPALRHELEALAASLDVTEAVQWFGTQQDIPRCLAEMDVAIVPSRYPESFGRSVIEAQAIGVPVVASKLGGLAEVIDDGRTGRLVPPEDPRALAEAIGQLLRDEALRERLVVAARAEVESRYSLTQMVESTLEVYEECLARPRIVVWKLSAAGDVVLATPSVRAIRRRFPLARISLVVSPPVYDLVARCPYVDEILMYNPKRKDRTWAGKWRFARRLRRVAFDLSIDLQNSRLTHLLTRLADVPVRVGYHRRWPWLLNHAVPMPKEPLHPVAHQQRLLQAADVPLDDQRLEVWPGPEHEQAVEALLRELGVDPQRPLAGVHPGGSPRWTSKRWDLDRWAALCDRLTEAGYQIIVTGTAPELELAQRLQSKTSASLRVAAGRTSLLELACVIRRCGVFVTHDSAPLHLASAVGTPVIALFGPTDAARHVTPSPSVRVIQKAVFCGPCYSGTCRTVTHACMKRIGVDEVAEAVADVTGHGAMAKGESLSPPRRRARAREASAHADPAPPVPPS